MVQTITIAQLLRDGILLTADEAVAIAQHLIHDRHPVSAGPPFGPPTPDTVSIDESGAVLCSTCDATPAVSEIGILLEGMLPPGTRAPGGLRYAIARALLNVDAPPFDSVQDFSRVLGRFEKADREALTRNLFERWRALMGHDAAAVIPFKATPPAAAKIERRRPIPSAIATELRRELRRTDLERYRLHVELARRERRQGPTRTQKMSAILAGFAAGLALIATGELMHRRYAIGDVIVPPGNTAVVSAPASPGQTDRSASDHLPDVDAAARSVPSNGSSMPAAPLRRRAPRRSAPGRRVTAGAPADAATRNAQRTNRSQTQNTAGDGSSPDSPAATPALESNGTAMFVLTGGPSPRTVLRGAGEELQVMTIAEDRAKNLHVQPSPDGRSVAFDSDRDGERGVYLADRDGSHVRRVSGAGDAAMPSWSPDSRQLAYLRRDPDSQHASNLWLLSIDSGAERRLTRYRAGQTWTASWFPDGRRLVHAHDGALVILDAQTGRTLEFTSPIEGRVVRMPAVSPDGRRVIFQVDGHGAWLLDLKDGSMRCALTDPTAEQFAWTSDGRRFAFHSRRTGEWGMWVG